MPHHAVSQRAGRTLVEQLIVLCVLGICLSIAFHSAANVLDAAVVHAAARDVDDMFALARDRAMSSGRRTAVHVDDVQRRLTVHADRDTIARVDLAARGVSISSTRDSMAYTSSGLGFGAANLRVIVARGNRRDTLTVSRLGRVKR